MAFTNETTYGTPGTISATAGLRLFFDSFADESDKRPLDFQEISGLSIDRSEFIEDAILIGGSLTYSMRYSGIHAVLAGFAMGDLTTTGTTPNFTHTATLADNLQALTLILQSPKMVAGAVTYVDDNFVGMKVARSTWSHRVGQPMKHRIDFIGSYLDHDTSAVIMPTTAGNGAGSSPTESHIMWHHRSGAIQIDIEPIGTPITINVTSYEITIDNGLERRFIIQSGRKSAEPARNDFRTVTARFEIDQDEGWEEFINAYGLLNSTASKDFTIKVVYDVPTGGQTLTLTLNNCRVIRVPRAIPGPGLLSQTVEMRAHFNSGAVPNNPIEFVLDNNTGGPTTPATYGAVVVPATP